MHTENPLQLVIPLFSQCCTNLYTILYGNITLSSRVSIQSFSAHKASNSKTLFHRMYTIVESRPRQYNKIFRIRYQTERSTLFRVCERELDSIQSGAVQKKKQKRHIILLLFFFLYCVWEKSIKQQQEIWFKFSL